MGFSIRRNSSISLPQTIKGDLDEKTISALEFGKKLTSFQITKFTYMFNALFDLDQNELIEKPDIDALVDKIRVFSKWGSDDKRLQSITDIHNVFYECLVDQVMAEKAASNLNPEIASWTEARKPTQNERTSISLAQWLNMWGRLCYGAAGMSDFPIWVQLLPKMFFDAIDQNEDGILSKEEYAKFYKDFVGVYDENFDKVINEGYRAMTAGGDYKLNRENFGFCFANFLLGRSIYGPGKYIFGVFDNSEIESTFKITYNEELEE